MGKSELIKMVVLRFGMFIVIMGLMFFLPAGTFRYWEAWVYIAILVTPMIIFLFYLIKHDPELLERRMRTKEKQAEQKTIIKIGSLIFILIYLIPGFDQRYGWSSVPVGIIIIADIIVFCGYLLFARVLMENSYASRIVEVEQQQTVITTGPYKIVRHPLYSAVLLMYCFGPLALDSYWTMIGSVLLVFLLVARIKNEEKVLSNELEGYQDYL
ncbi:MAG: isoprenylcysteine carboxylmethyltransferase family protein, partial [bacterium]